MMHGVARFGYGAFSSDARMVRPIFVHGTPSCVDGEMGWDIYMAVLGWHLFYLADEYFGKLAPIKLC